MGFLEALIRRKVLTTVLLLIAVLMGALSYLYIGVRRFPDIDFPVAMVITTYPGATPAEVESEITTTIEDAISTVSGIDEMQSYSQHGLSMITVQFDLEEDIDFKAMDLRDEIDLIRQRLPDDAEDPIVRKFDFEQLPVISLALTGSYDTNELLTLAEDNLEDPLRQIPGVGEVEITGGQSREIQLPLNPIKMRAKSVSIDQIAEALQSGNLEISGGDINQPYVEYPLRSSGKFKTLEDIAEQPVATNEWSTVDVADFGEVVDSFEDETERSRADGQVSVVLSIQKQADANDVEISDQVQAMLPELRELMPDDTQLFITEDTSDFIRGSLNNVRNNIILGMLLTGLALYLFLNSWRSTVIVVVVMPSALISSFILMLYSGISLNILTLTALALAVGIVVNNSILVLETVHRFVDQGMPPVEAAIKGVKDIGLAIISSTATNLVVFLPIAFMGEIIGRFFREFGLAIVFVTIVSLVISFTLTPMMCGLMLKKQKTGEKEGLFLGVLHFLPAIWQWSVDWLRDNYLAVLEWCLKWRKTTLLLTVSLVVISFVGLIKVVGAEFFPPSDEGAFRVSVETNLGSSLDWTDDRVAALESVIEEEISPEYLEHYYSRIGTTSSTMGGVSSGSHLGEISVTLVDSMERPESVDEILNRLRPRLAQVHSVKFTLTTEGGGPGGSPIEINIYGADMQLLQETAGRIQNLVEEIRGTTDVDQSYRSGRTDQVFNPDHEKLERHNLNSRTLGSTLRSYIEGRVATQFSEQDEEYDIRVRLAEEYRQWGESVEYMFIPSPVTGRMVPITELGEMKYVAGPVSIMRKDRQRQITVSSQLTGEYTLGEVRERIEQAIEEKVEVPEGVRVDFGGEVEMMRNNFAELYQAMAIATVLTFLGTAGIIESFFLAVIILLTVPVAFIGVTLAFILGGIQLNVFSLMAMIMLVGMVVNNAIVILDYATRSEQQELPPWRRVYEACSVRFRVLLMANLTTIAAMVPLSLGLGFGGEIFRPLALVQMGGLAAAGTLALLVIPVIFTSWYTFVEKRRKS